MKKEERKELLKLYSDLRVCDVRDGMDALGYFFYGSMDSTIRPLFRTTAFGIAKTVRYLPFRGIIKYKDPRDYRDNYTPYYYNNICKYPWCNKIEEGDFVVIDQSLSNVGVMGSENSLNCKNSGMSGLVTNGGVRDTNEIILENVPVWSASIAQTMVQVRLEFDAMDVPVSVGGVNIHPDDMIIADGDGVIAVPYSIAKEVAIYAHEEHNNDKQDRKKGYLDAGLENDGTI